MEHTGCQGKPNRELMEEICPVCGEIIEFWGDDTTGVCDKCGKTILNPKMECIFRCDTARQCVGEEAYQRAMQASDRIQFDPEKFKNFTRW